MLNMLYTIWALIDACSEVRLTVKYIQTYNFNN